jgi:hypothetical protein
MKLIIAFVILIIGLNTFHLTPLSTYFRVLLFVLSVIGFVVNIKVILKIINSKTNINFQINGEPWKVNNLKPLDSKKVLQWKTFPNTFENKFIIKFSEKEIQFYGYKKSNFPNIRLFYLCKVYIKSIHAILKSF